MKERPMGMVNPQSKKAQSDPFRPTGNRLVRCCTCDDEYPESEVVWEVRKRFTPHINGALWWCRNKDCAGAGVGFDIFPVDDQNAEDETND